MDHEEVNGPDHHPKTQLGHILKRLDQEIRKANTPSQLEMTEEIKNILQEVAELRVRTRDNENVEDCQNIPSHTKIMV